MTIRQLRTLVKRACDRLTQRVILRALAGGWVALALACAIQPSVGDVAHPSWDTDGDNISVAVELWPANARYQFDTARNDPNPSVANGFPGSGTLTGGINFPDVDPGVGVYEFRPNPPGSAYYDPAYDQPDSNDWGTLALINTIEATGRDWTDLDPLDSTCYYYNYLYDSLPAAARFGIGDMSKFGGGVWLHTYDGGHRHYDHQNGLDVDVRYLRLDALSDPLSLRDDSAAVANGGASRYDRWSTIDLFQCFIHTRNIELVYADSSLLGFWIAGVLVNDESHYDHFHVQIHQP